jgi:hypothetical protein
MKVRYDGRTIGHIVTNRSMTVWEALDIIGVDPNEMDGGDPVYDLERFDLAEDGVEIAGVDTRPQRDTEANIPGTATVSVLKLDPGTRRVWIEQENAQGAMVMDEYYNVTLTHRLSARPDQDAARDYLDSDDGQDLLMQVVAGWSREWDGRNHVGRLTEDAEEAWQQIIADIEDLPPSEWSLWPVEDWLHDWAAESIRVTTTDRELERMAADAEANAESEHVVIDGDALDYLTERRDSLLDAMSDDLTVDQAVALAAEYGKAISPRGVRYAASHGLIRRARKIGRDWIVEQGAYLRYLLNPPRQANRKAK